MIRTLLTNRNSHGDFIRHALLSAGEAGEPVYIASAFFTDHAVLREIAFKSKQVRLVVRLGFPTSPKALKEAMDDRNVDVRFFTDATFHPKLYVFGSRVAFVGSANLTGSAVLSNQEIMVAIDCEDHRFIDLSTLFGEYWSQASVLDPEALDKYRAVYEAHKKLDDQVSQFDRAVGESLGNVRFENIDRGRVSKSKENIFVEGYRKVYQETVSAFRAIREEFEADGRRKVAEDRLPLRLEIDSFFSFVRDHIAKGETWAERPVGWNADRQDELRKALDQWHATTWPHLETRIVETNYPRLLKVFGAPKTIREASDDALFDALLTLHSFHDSLRFHAGGIPGLRKAFIGGNDPRVVRECLAYLVHGEDELVQRMANVLYGAVEKPSAFGQANVQELIGWHNREDLPVINGRTTKILRYFGFAVRQL
ncbi:phospholipase D family protein [Luteimonas vadosa]|uniref:PLD phosphodiesterase domain-containing protein n=1 Tax=Luteimonas vadosa TaxID=1165507 RepID=A0ABP9DXW0_9GAMM